MHGLATLTNETVQNLKKSYRMLRTVESGGSGGGTDPPPMYYGCCGRRVLEDPNVDAALDGRLLGVTAALRGVGGGTENRYCVECRGDDEAV